MSGTVLKTREKSRNFLFLNFDKENSLNASRMAEILSLKYIQWSRTWYLLQCWCKPFTLLWIWVYNYLSDFGAVVWLNLYNCSLFKFECICIIVYSDDLKFLFYAQYLNLRPGQVSCEEAQPSVGRVVEQKSLETSNIYLLNNSRVSAIYRSLFHPHHNMVFIYSMEYMRWWHLFGNKLLACFLCPVFWDH